MDEAARHGITVSLAHWSTANRWPECHQPDHVPTQRQLLENKPSMLSWKWWVKRYEHHPALESWQLENEGGK